VASKKALEGFAAVTGVGRRLWVAFSALPQNTRYAIWAALAFCGVAAIGLILALGPLRPVPIEKSLGTARVQAAQTELVETQAPGSARLMVLKKGTGLNVLSHITDPSQRLVRVQVVMPKPRRPGYVAWADLGQWSSNDPQVDWEYRALSRPASGASSDSIRLFSQTLTTFSERFPGTRQARLASLEQAQIHLAFAEQAKAAGKERSEWQADLDVAKKAMDLSGISENSPDEEKGLLSRYQDLNRVQESEVPASAGPEEMRVAAELARYGLLAQNAFWAYRFDECEAAAKKMIDIAPNNKKAVKDANWWLDKIQKARERLAQ
jgi:hypothetical protein